MAGDSQHALDSLLSVEVGRLNKAAPARWCVLQSPLRTGQANFAAGGSAQCTAVQHTHLNTSRSRTQTVASDVAATVAVRGQLYSSDTSPNTSPFSFVLTRMLTPFRRSST